jgi:hypothetical protein
LKIKARLQQEFVVCGLTEGKGSRKHFGAIIPTNIRVALRQLSCSSLSSRITIKLGPERFLVAFPC